MRRRRPPLSADQKLNIRVDAITSNVAAAVANGERAQDAAVAEIATAAEGRADIIDEVIESIAQLDRATRAQDDPGSGGLYVPLPSFADWPPRALRLELLAAARERLLG